jgi:hypothetical protein
MSDEDHEPWRLESHMGVAPYPHPDHVDADDEADESGAPQFAPEAGERMTESEPADDADAAH